MQCFLKLNFQLLSPSLIKYTVRDVVNLNDIDYNNINSLKSIMYAMTDENRNISIITIIFISCNLFLSIDINLDQSAIKQTEKINIINV